MKKNYDVNRFFDYLGYYPTNYTPTCPGMRTLSVFLKGDRAQLEAMLEPTPFLLADDRFMVTIADFRNQSHFSFFDAAVLLPVRFGDVEGSTYYFEYEDSHETVASGREKWGYPKRYARITLEDDGQGARGDVTLYDETMFRIAVEFDDATNNAAWSDYRIFPHLQIRAVSEIYGPSFSSFDIVSRDTSRDYRPISKTFGRASVELGPSIAVNGRRLQVLDVLGGEYAVGDFASTRENGRANVVGSLV